MFLLGFSRSMGGAPPRMGSTSSARDNLLHAVTRVTSFRSRRPGSRRPFPDVRVLAHPECSPEVIAASDMSGGTGEMIRYVQKLDRGRLLLLTEDRTIAVVPA